MKLRIILDDETRPVLEALARAGREVANWPAWKRGEPPCSEAHCERELDHEGKHRRSRTVFDEW